MICEKILFAVGGCVESIENVRAESSSSAGTGDSSWGDPELKGGAHQAQQQVDRGQQEEGARLESTPLRPFSAKSGSATTFGSNSSGGSRFKIINILNGQFETKILYTLYRSARSKFGSDFGLILQ